MDSQDSSICYRPSHASSVFLYARDQILKTISSVRGLSRPPLAVPSTLPRTPILMRNSFNVVHIQDVGAFSHEHPPQVVSHSERPGRHAPVANFETSGVRSTYLISDQFCLRMRQSRMPRVPNRFHKGDRCIIEVGRRIDCGICGVLERFIS